MKGKNLTNQVLLEFPETKILFMSNYTDELLSHEGLIDNHIDFIQKPFTAESLTKKIRSVLDGNIHNP